MEEKHLNKLYKASLQFGANWMRPLPELAKEMLPRLNESERECLCKCVDIARRSINEYIEKQYEYEKGLTLPEDEVVMWISQNFPWMNKRNISHGISQGLYYAWHG